MLYMKVVKSYHKKKSFFYLILYLQEMMDVH